MPTYLRRFYIRKLNSTLQEKNDIVEGSNEDIEDIKEKLAKPGIKPPPNPNKP